MSLKFTVIDAFTNNPFSGNPAGVVILPSDTRYESQVLQNIAAELNLSETAFIQPRVITHNDTGGALSCPIKEREQLHGAGWTTFGLRWFTPTEEVRLCGHATLASASLLFSEESLVPADTHEIRFVTLSGVLVAKRIVTEESPSENLKYELEFPAAEIVPASEGVAKRVRDAVASATIPDTGISFVGVCGKKPYEQYVLVEIDNNHALEGMKVNAGVLKSLAPEYVVIVLCQKLAHGSHDIAYRMFAPAAGIDEDPVCGSAVSFSAQYWTERTDTAPEDTVRLRAASPRGGDVELVWEKSTSTARMRGQARIASRGEIYL